jgi:hypothetical protein
LLGGAGGGALVVTTLLGATFTAVTVPLDAPVTMPPMFKLLPEPN